MFFREQWHQCVSLIVRFRPTWKLLAAINWASMFCQTCLHSPWKHVPQPVFATGLIATSCFKNRIWRLPLHCRVVSSNTSSFTHRSRGKMLTKTFWDYSWVKSAPGSTFPQLLAALTTQPVASFSVHSHTVDNVLAVSFFYNINAVLYTQLLPSSTLSQIFRINILLWLDDILTHATDAYDLLRVTLTFRLYYNRSKKIRQAKWAPFTCWLRWSSCMLAKTALFSNAGIFEIRNMFEPTTAVERS